MTTITDHAPDVERIPVCIVCGGDVVWNETKAEWWHVVSTPKEGGRA